jgi:hypothetical protein
MAIINKLFEIPAFRKTEPLNIIRSSQTFSVDLFACELCYPSRGNKTYTSVLTCLQFFTGTSRETTKIG